MNKFWLVFRKELRCCSRDPDVLIYSFLLPLVLYPLCAVLVNEASLWHSSMQEKNKPTVYVKGTPELAGAVAWGLRKRKHFAVVRELSSSEAEQDNGAIINQAGELQKEAAAVVNADAVTSKIDIQAHEKSSHLGTIAEQIESDVRATRFKSLSQDLKAKKLPADIMTVFSVQRQGLKKPHTTASTDSNLKLMLDKLLAMLVVFIILEMTIIGGPASVCLMAEEHEKKTYYTTLLLPVNRMVIIISKFLTVAVISICGAAFNLFCVFIFTLSLLFSALGQTSFLSRFFSDLFHPTIYRAAYYFGNGAMLIQRARAYIQFPTLSDLVMMTLFFFSTGLLLAAIYLCIAGYAKTVKSAQMLVSLPMILLMSLPTIALIPGIQFTPLTALIPIANLLIMRKYENPPLLPSLIALIEPVILIVLILNLVRIVFESHIGNTRDKSASKLGAS